MNGNIWQTRVLARRLLLKFPTDWTADTTKCICPNGLMYLSKLQNVFAQMAKCICPNCKIYLSKLTKVFVQIDKCICPNWQMYLSKLANVFVSDVCQPGIREVLWTSSLPTMTADTEAELWRRDLFITLKLRGCSFAQYFSSNFSYFHICQFVHISP